MEGIGTDEDALYAAAAAVRGQAEWEQVIQAYRLQHPETWGGDLIAALQDELNADEEKELARILAAVGVTWNEEQDPRLCVVMMLFAHIFGGLVFNGMWTIIAVAGGRAHPAAVLLGIVALIVAALIVLYTFRVVQLVQRGVSGGDDDAGDDFVTF
eukprot:gene6044-23159_t